MWDIYRRKQKIFVEFRNGHKTWVNAFEASLLSLAIKNGLDVEKILNFIQMERFNKNRLYLLNLAIRKGLDENMAIEYAKHDTILYKNTPVVMHLPADKGISILEIFYSEVYKFLNVENKTVVDIGGFVADSAIYFALNGAKKVIMLEPCLKFFEYAIRNVKENNLEEKIILLNAAYGLNEEISLDKTVERILNKDAKQNFNERKIRIYSLEELIKEFNIREAVLKMDCEGCEYNLINENNQILSTFSSIQIEFHHGYEELLEKLKDAGFDVKVELNGKNFGYIYAKRNQK